VRYIEYWFLFDDIKIYKIVKDLTSLFQIVLLNEIFNGENKNRERREQGESKECDKQQMISYTYASIYPGTMVIKSFYT